MKFLRIFFIGILIVSAVLSFIVMSPFLLLYWFIWAKDQRDATEMVRAAIAKRSGIEK